jgi:hypothetical protein
MKFVSVVSAGRRTLAARHACADVGGKPIAVAVIITPQRQF